MRFLAKFLLAPLLALASCQGATTGPEVDETEATAIADAYIARRLPQVPRDMLHTEVEDRGATWRVNFLPPPDSIGALTVDVDKRSRQVVNFIGHQ